MLTWGGGGRNEVWQQMKMVKVDAVHGFHGQMKSRIRLLGLKVGSESGGIHNSCEPTLFYL